VTNVETGLQQAGDADDNNVVTVADFIVTKNAFGRGIGEPGYDDRTDFDGNQVINVFDFTLLKTNFGQSGDPPIR